MCVLNKSCVKLVTLEINLIKNMLRTLGYLQLHLQVDSLIAKIEIVKVKP